MQSNSSPQLKVQPIAADSLGVRSMATYIETPNLNIIIDPGAALAPWRSGYPPHIKELRKLSEMWNLIKEKLREASLVVITHYHYDHLNPQELDLFVGKKLFIKDPLNTNSSQRRRALDLLTSLRELEVDFEIADGKSINISGVDLTFSKALTHGKGEDRGKVIMVHLSYGGNSFLFTSDSQGLPTVYHVEFLRRKRANIIYLDGPPTYLLGGSLKVKEFEESMENLYRLLEEVPPETLIVDHHLLRDHQWRSKCKTLFHLGEKVGFSIETAASFLGESEELLEARRSALYTEREKGVSLENAP